MRQRGRGGGVAERERSCGASIEEEMAALCGERRRGRDLSSAEKQGMRKWRKQKGGRCGRSPRGMPELRGARSVHQRALRLREMEDPDWHRLPSP